MAEYFKCGHNKGWGLKLRDGGKLHIYCLGCVVEKLGLTDYNSGDIAHNDAIRQKEIKLQEEKLKPKKKEEN